MKKVIAAVVILLLLGGGAALIVGSKDDKTNKTGDTSSSTASADSSNSTNTSADTSSPAPAEKALTASVDITNFAFDSANLVVKKGTTVTWTNNDSSQHTVTGSKGGPDSGGMSQGKTYSFKFDTVGAFPYECKFHSNMKGTVTVTE